MLVLPHALLKALSCPCCIPRFITNKYLLKPPSKDYDVEWGYAFDVHLNAFYPLLVILHFLQLFFINRECRLVITHF